MKASFDEQFRTTVTVYTESGESTMSHTVLAMSHQCTRDEAQKPTTSRPDTEQQEEQMSHMLQWSTLLDLLTTRLKEATQAAGKDGREMSLEEHNAYYHAAFDKVREEAASRGDIPNAIMEKPIKTLILTFYGGWSDVVCLSCLDFHDGNDIIHVEIHAKEDEPDGVTKDDLVRSIGEVLYGGLHVAYGVLKKEIRIVLSDINWKGTTTLCNLVDNIVYVGYAPAANDSEEGGGEKNHGKYEISWDSEALGSRSWAIQGFDVEYSRRLMVAKGWQREDFDTSMVS
ncbi:hypothetical protein F4677DRAFT_335259 [Hypoxylon crocopeplum]|nr:hypothetical protein F4677DRAFT_335259 [Hypoxylon crocopeplum]